MPHITTLAFVLATVAVLVIFGLTWLGRRSAKRTAEMIDLMELVERERAVLRPDFGHEPDARRSMSGPPRARRGPIERVTLEPWNLIER